MVNAVHMKVAILQQEAFEHANPEHVVLLESLWESLKSGSRRTDWGELGFQNGKVPQSDFRGMGMLGESGVAWCGGTHSHNSAGALPCCCRLLFQ